MPDPAQFVIVSQPPQRGAIKKPTDQDPNANTDLFSRLFSEEGTLHFSLQLFDSVEQLVTYRPTEDKNQDVNFLYSYEGCVNLKANDNSSVNPVGCQHTRATARKPSGEWKHLP